MTDPRPLPNVEWHAAGCARDCSEQHTYVWGRCALAPESARPQPTISIGRVEMEDDGQPGIVLREIPTAAWDALITVAKWVSRGKSMALDADPDIAPAYPDAAARRALGALHDAGLLDEQRPAPAATKATEPTECPPGVHSIFDPCPGDCGKPLDDEPDLAQLQRHAQDLSRKTGLAVTVEPFHDQYKISVEHPAGTTSHGGYDPRETHAMLLGIGMATTANTAIVQAAAHAEGTDTATWTAVRAIQLMQEAGRQRDAAQAAIERVRAARDRMARGREVDAIWCLDVLDAALDGPAPDHPSVTHDQCGTVKAVPSPKETA